MVQDSENGEFDREQFLTAMDDFAAINRFPDLSAGYLYPAGTRLSVYTNAIAKLGIRCNSWAIVIEILAFDPKVRGTNGIYDIVTLFGNHLRTPQGKTGISQYRISYCTFLSDGPEGPLFLPPNHSMRGSATVSPLAKSVTVRGAVFPISTNAAEYAELGIPLSDLPWLRGEELLRWFALKYPALSWRSEVEIASELTELPPLMLRLNEWHHPDVGMDERPSETEFLGLIADVIATGDVSQYQPSEKPNTHWSNWPMAGSL
jgi:hypothetical protein